MITALITMGGLGLIIGVGLAVASKVFYVYVDPTVLAVEEALPGANCGGCGMPGCSANAEAIVTGKAAPNSCVAGGADLAQTIAAILGVSVSATEPDFARPGCYYGTGEADLKYLYQGISDCRAASLLSGGMKICSVGCLGLGTCVRSCPFKALSMGPDHLPVVDAAKCTGCGTCERACPKSIIKLSSVTRRIMREYTDEECTTPCQRACPAGISIRDYVGKIADGKFSEAVAVIKERNPFPAVIGRICPHPCEFACRRNLVDESVAINCLKRFAADIEMQSGSRILPYKAPATGKKTAVVGGGIEGLSTAFFLARLGHAPTVFEASDHAGGLLRSAIPETRLSRKVLDWEIQGVVEMGVTVITNSAIGRDITVTGLLAQGYNAVFLAPGGWDMRLALDAGKVPPPALPGVFLLIDVMQKKAGIKLGKNPVFVGGGKAAVSAALAACDGPFTVLVRADEQSAGIPSELLEQAKAKSGKLLFASAVTALSGTDDELSGLSVISLNNGEKQEIKASALVVSAGRVPELIVRRRPVEEENKEKDPEATEGPVEWEALPPYKKPADGLPEGLLSPADALTDFSAAVEAIGAGRRAAASIQMLLYGKDIVLSGNVITPHMYIQDVDAIHGVAPAPREVMPTASEGQERPFPELELGYTKEMALAEANRCLRCGLICYRHEHGEAA
ncbi:MAG: RnfABCDGE type electron transport complex subunit B [Thermodesulfobacteriota bacterium]